MRNQQAKNIQTEIDACFLYKKLSEHEADNQIANVFKQMGEIEQKHAIAMFKRYYPQADVVLPQPSIRARIINLIGLTFGYDYVLSALTDTEKSISKAVLVHKKQKHLSISGNETNHVEILQAILEKEKNYGSNIARFERKHRSIGGNALRAAVLGGNDGLVSNFGLVMGIAGTAADQRTIMLTGIAGLLAGALSMALGEWISVKSSQELYESQMQIEMEEIETSPEDEQKELELIYMAKGISEAEAKKMAAEVLKNKEKTHEILVQEELGITTEDLKSSAKEAAVFSFTLFAIGAIIPLLPYFFARGTTAIIISVVLSAIGLFLIGTIITLFTNKSIYYSGFRQVVFGVIAAAITFSIGKIIGISIA